MILIPIGHEDQKVVRLPWVTIALVLANVAVFLITHGMAQRQSDAIHHQLREVVGFAQEHPYLQLPPEFARVIRPVHPPAELPADTVADQQAQLDNLLQHLETLSSGSVFRTYGYTPAHPSLLTLFTSMFLHAGWLHLLGNMLFLWLAGTSLEDRWGRILFPLLYLASGAVATLIHGFMHPQSAIPLVGASGAIAGLMGAFLVRLATTRIKFLYWLFFFRGTFHVPAYVVLPLWLLQQFAMVRGEAGGVAVWAHIGGFGVGVVAALLIRLTDLEGRFLAPAIQEKTSWKASEPLTAALEQLDRGETDAAVTKLEALVKGQPNSIEARTALLAAYARQENHAAAGRESAQLVGAYVRARDMDGALAAAEEHARTYKDVPLSLRNLLFLAAHREKRGEHAEASRVYQQAIAAWPDDPLTPRALAAYGRAMLRTFHDPRAAVELLEQARVHPKVTPEILKFSQELLAEGRAELGRMEEPPPEAPPAAPEPDFSASSPSLLDAQAVEAPAMPEPTLSAPAFSPPEAPPTEEAPAASGPVVWELSPQAEPEVEPEPEGPGVSGPSVPEPAPEPPSAPSQSELQVELELETAAVPPEPPAPPAPALQVEEGQEEGPSLEVAPAPPPQRTLVAVPMRAVGLDARGLQLQARTGGSGRLAWQHVAALSVGSLGAAQGPDQVADSLILDLYLAPSATPAGVTFHSVRLGVKDLAVPQLQGETSPVRTFQRFVATILKATTATPYPSREACLGVRGFPAYPDLAAYEADLLPRLPGPE